MTGPKVSIVIVTYNSSSEIVNAIDSIHRFLVDVSYEIIVVDNNSSDNTVQSVEAAGREVKLIRNKKNNGFAFANNQGFKEAAGEFILVFNPDLILTENSRISELVSILIASPSIGIIAPRLYYANGEIQESARGFPNLVAQAIRLFKLDKYFGSSKVYERFVVAVSRIQDDIFVDWVIGAFMLVPKDLLFKVGLFDTRYFMYYEDADLCKKMHRAGYKVCYTPRFSTIHKYHRESAKGVFSKLKMTHIMSSLKFYLKWI